MLERVRFHVGNDSLVRDRELQAYRSTDTRETRDREPRGERKGAK